MTDFTTKNPGLPPVRHSPGKLGQEAAARGAKQAGSSPGGSSRGGGTSPSRLTAKGGKGSSLAPQGEEEQPDYRHAVLAAQYQNMRQMGREIPFGAYLVRNGYHRDLDVRPFDLFLDS